MGDPVCDKSSNHGADCRHECVVKPQLLLARGQDNRCCIHGARERDEGVVQDPERNQSKAAKLKEPEAQPSYGSREQRRDCVADEHFRSVLCFTQLHSRMQLWRSLDTIARSNAPRFVVRGYSIFLAVRTKHSISTQKMILILMLKSVVVYALVA